MKSTFYQWLMEQCDEDSPIGDLACDARSDTGFPKQVSSRDTLVGYLQQRGACREAIETAHEAWSAWKA
jgi:uncharacterized protein YozE (UPF0346 family)